MRNDRIWNVFEATVVLDELSIKKEKKEDSPDRNIEDSVSVRYPLIKINDYIFGEEEIEHFTIDSRNFLPTITLTVQFSNELFVSKNLPKDGDIISVMIRNKSDLLKPIRNDYVITGHAQQHQSTFNKDKPVKLTFFGELFVPGIRGYRGSKSYRGTSMETLKKIAQALELGFNTNEDETDDLQIWLKTGTAAEFIKEITKRSWKDENSFFECWIDVYYNLNFVNLQKELLAQEIEIDYAALLNSVDNEFEYGSDTETTYKTPKVFSNFAGLRSTSNYITSWKPSNKSTAITFDYGTTTELSFFEHQNALYSDPEAQKYWNFAVPVKYDPDKLDSYIILRGRPTYNPEINTDQTARANYDYSELYTRAPWLGVQYTISNPEEDPSQWTGNHHKNYMRAQVHNMINLIELEKLTVEIKVQGTNLSFVKGEKAPVAIIKTDPVEVQLVQNDLQQPEELDFFYSGWYIIKGFKLEWARNKTILSNFSQTFVLTRREWPPPEPVQPAAKPIPQNNAAT